MNKVVSESLSLVIFLHLLIDKIVSSHSAVRITEYLSGYHEREYCLRDQGIVYAHSLAVVLAPIRYLYPRAPPPGVVRAQRVQS